MTSTTFALSDNIILRDEPQYFESYVVYDYKKNLHLQVDAATLDILQQISETSLCARCISGVISKQKERYTLNEMIFLGWIIEYKDTTCNHRQAKRQKIPNWVQALPPVSSADLQERKH